MKWLFYSYKAAPTPVKWAFWYLLALILTPSIIFWRVGLGVLIVVGAILAVIASIHLAKYLMGEYPYERRSVNSGSYRSY